MKTTITSLLVISLFSITLGYSQSEKIEGIHYLTGKPIVIEINGSLISKIKYPNKIVSKTYFVAPGLIDLQINGYMGVDFSDQTLTSENFEKATKALWGKGITCFLPTVITASRENLLKSFSLLAKASFTADVAASVPGFHLEGPYISPEKGFRGAHLEKYIRKPDWNEFSAFQKASGNKIKLVTLAPETDGANSFIANCKKSGIVVLLGHHNGNASQIENAVNA